MCIRDSSQADVCHGGSLSVASNPIVSATVEIAMIQKINGSNDMRWLVNLAVQSEAPISTAPSKPHSRPVIVSLPRVILF